ncbi:hypothetical protein, partial [Leptospira sp. id769339]|uniref:hypothetical protein n=1 Tax=Leptospira sp. id769339 TaxID=2864221 RepID=UPI00214B2AE8
RSLLRLADPKNSIFQFNNKRKMYYYNLRICRNSNSGKRLLDEQAFSLTKIGEMGVLRAKVWKN